jgi:hypothetical protein
VSFFGPGHVIADNFGVHVGTVINRRLNLLEIAQCLVTHVVRFVRLRLPVFGPFMANVPF